MIKGYLIPGTIEEICDCLLKVKIDQDYKIIKDAVKTNEIYTIEEALVLQVGEEQWRSQLDSTQIDN